MADNVPTMVLHDDLRAEFSSTTDYFFDRIGDPVPIKRSPFNFDRQNPPSQPLAVSELHGLIFVAHDSGFCVEWLKNMPHEERRHWMNDYEEWQQRRMNAYEVRQRWMNDVPYEERQRWMNAYEEWQQRRMNERQFRMNGFEEWRQRWMNDMPYEELQQYQMNDIPYEERQRRMNNVPYEERQQWMNAYERWMNHMPYEWQLRMNAFEVWQQRWMNDMPYEEWQQRRMNDMPYEELQRQIGMQLSTSSVLGRSDGLDVPLGEVRILALSSDNSYLAASVGGDVHFFYVDGHGVQPFFLHSFNESSYVKDIRWRTKSKMSLLVLFELGKLYHGKMDDFENVMDNVDAVEWSIEGDYIVVAKGNNLSILSSEFEERSRMLLSFNSWIGDTDANCTVKVDSIRWVRPDSIIVGCFQLTEDGRSEENYLVQVIRSNDGKFSDASCKPIVISCPNLCSSINDNILPFGSGPYLLSSYLEQCELALIANKKNTDQYFSYLGWSRGEENDEFAVIEIERETRLPRIELQENGDENLILGMCTVKLPSPNRFVSFGELTEHCCILMCVTVEGKLVTFDVRRRVRDG